MYFPETKEVMPTRTVEAMVDAYNDALREITEAYTLLGSAKKRLGAFFGSYKDYVVPDGGLGHYDGDEPERTIKTVANMIKKNAWRAVLEKTGLKALASTKRVVKLEEDIEKGEVPELTVDTVNATLEGLIGRIPELMEETVKETFDFLRPWRDDGYKTNEAFAHFEVTKKVIIEYGVETWYSSVSVNHYKEKFFRGMDNAFHLMDGKGPVKYPGDLVTKMKEAIREGAWDCETEYFKCKWFKKGTVHIVFKREDLVRKMNAIAAGGTISRKAA